MNAENASLSAAAERTDVLIVGAGISGIAAGVHLQQLDPTRDFLIVDGETDFGGTWLTHSYPGLRSDSDLFTFGFGFKPWTGNPIGSGEEIRHYLGETVGEHGLLPRMRLGYRVTQASWNSKSCLWMVRALTATGDEKAFTARFLSMCQGYFRHRQGHMPRWSGVEDFAGQVVHAQEWPSNLKLDDKRVLVIGSGATAATLVPALAGRTSHTTMLQRSPTYFTFGANRNDLAERLRTLDVPSTWIHEIVRRDLLDRQATFARRCADEPETVREELLSAVRAVVGADQTAAHFSPSYRPWQQRIAHLPGADLLHAVKSGRASIATGEIERFTAGGVLLRSGAQIEADVVIAATGFDMNILGDINFAVDGRPLDFAKSVTYRGMMFTGLPNLTWVFGYIRSSWTLRSELVGAFTARLVGYMAENGLGKVEVVLPGTATNLPRRPWVDPANFNPGYISRALNRLPRGLDDPEWRHSLDYEADRITFPTIDFNSPAFAFTRPSPEGDRCGPP
ncbi:flavin-containing monooxygenase [Caulobacter sp. KR2-114]|uniref:flavin-containing monooxygenase n=1 Tax=Caulobacter sp. KR2-114 TaxID=3400912 RepID=UPI003C092FD9